MMNVSNAKEKSSKASTHMLPFDFGMRRFTDIANASWGLIPIHMLQLFQPWL